MLTFTKLVGHSMGGSVMVLAVSLLLEKKYRITGVGVLDVVEGESCRHAEASAR